MCKSACHLLYSLTVPQPLRGLKGDKASLHSTVLCTNGNVAPKSSTSNPSPRCHRPHRATLPRLIFAPSHLHEGNTQTEAGNATLIGVAFHHTLPLSSRHIQYIASQGRTTTPPIQPCPPACLSVCPLSSSCNQIAHLSLIGQLPRYSSYPRYHAVSHVA